MTPATVLHLAANRWWTGSADPVIRVVAALRRRGHRVLLGIIPGDRFEAKAREAGLEPLAGLRLGSRPDPLGLVRDVRRLRAVIAGEGVEIVHCHHSHDHWLGRLAGAGVGRPPALVRTFHNFRAVRGDRLSAWLYRHTAAVLAVSRQIESRCRERGIAEERVTWVPAVADLERFLAPADPATIRRELGLGAAPVVVSVARLAPNRGHEVLLAGFGRLAASFPGARLLLVGKGETRPRLERLVADLGLQARVTFAGYRDGDLPAVLAAADCFVLMAAGSDESCRAALEAMAAGKPVVARRVGALPEIVVHGDTGLLLDGDEPEALARALARVLGDRERARTMGEAGRRRALGDFGPERAAAIVEAVYDRHRSG